jgi:hypothetical protein
MYKGNLPCGITGFGEVSIDERVHQKEFIKLLSYLEYTFKLLKFEKIKTNHESYYLGRFFMRKSAYYILVNKQFPFIAFADKYEYGNANYFDLPLILNSESP